MAKSIDNVLSEGFRLVQKNYLKFLELYLLFIAIFAVIGFVAGILLVVLMAGGSLTGVMGTGLASLVFIVVVVLAVVFLVEPLWIGSYYAIALQYLKGEAISVFGAVGKARQKYVQLLWTMALETLVFVVVDVLIFSPLFGPASTLFAAVSSSGSWSSAAATHALLSLFAFGIVLAIIYLLVTLALAPLLYEAVPLVMLENVRGVNALGESVKMGKSNFWNLVWLIVLFAIIYGLISLGQEAVVLVFGLLGVLAGSIIGVLASLLVGAFVTAWLYVLPIIFYNDFLSKKS